MIQIDGSQGEGGGQILRTSLSLSMITGQPFRIDNIRAGRPKPGLMRQHLTSVEAARAVCSGGVFGAALGSTSLEFTPAKIRGGEFTFSIGTAGSTTLVLQTILPALITASTESEVVLTGGTHNIHAPSTDFLQRAFLPLINRMGPSVRLELERYGFFPAGGGRIRVHVEPTERLRPSELMDASPISARSATATSVGLPPSIATREIGVLSETLGWPEECLQIRQLTQDEGPGNVVSIDVGRQEITEVFTGFGERGVSAEKVAGKAAKDAQRYIDAGVPVWRYLADQLMLPLALAGGGGFKTGRLSQHSETNAEVIERFLPVRVLKKCLDKGVHHVQIAPEL
ncbi:MAG: RNA 3'-terminal phosphate cyclase [Phycisphaerales bacterium]